MKFSKKTKLTQWSGNTFWFVYLGDPLTKAVAKDKNWTHLQTGNLVFCKILSLDTIKLSGYNSIIKFRPKKVKSGSVTMHIRTVL